LSFLIEGTTFTIREPGNVTSFDIFGSRISSDNLQIAIKVRKKTAEIEGALSQWKSWIRINQKAIMENCSLESEKRIFHFRCNLHNMQPDHIVGLLVILHEIRKVATITSVSWTSDGTIPSFLM
jgi:hypothetical protein